MTWTTLALIVSVWLNVSLVAGLAWSHSRLHAERKRCRRQCPLTATVMAQKRALDTAWVELNKIAQEKRPYHDPDLPKWRRFDIGGGP